MDDSSKLDDLDLDFVKCVYVPTQSFNIPRISAELERILGTNVIRLTDRHYMKQLRARVEADFAIRLSKRIRSREVKELERERNLILEGKTDQVPDELASDPVFVVNKRAGIEIAKRRANLRTSREKCAERLIRQAEKWKRERERYQEEEALKQQKLKQRKVYQAELERKYAKENAKLGLNLLRINDTEWQPCEQDLRDFLENERMKIKERAERESMPFSSDPLDIVNVMRERKKRLEEARIQRREQRRLQKLQVAAKSVKKQKPAAKKTASKEVQKKTSTAAKKADAEETATIYLDDDEASGIPSSPEPSLMKKPVKGPNVVEIEQQTDVDAQKQGYLVTVDQYNNLRYQDKTLNKLHATPNIKELYALAERIVICDIEEEALPEEEEEEID